MGGGGGTLPGGRGTLPAWGGGRGVHFRGVPMPVGYEPGLPYCLAGPNCVNFAIIRLKFNHFGANI